MPTQERMVAKIVLDQWAAAEEPIAESKDESMRQWASEVPEMVGQT